MGGIRWADYEAEVLEWMKTGNHYRIFSRKYPYVPMLRNHLASRGMNVTEYQVDNYRRNKRRKVKSLESIYLSTADPEVPIKQSIRKALQSQMRYFFEYYELYKKSTSYFARFGPARSAPECDPSATLASDEACCGNLSTIEENLSTESPDTSDNELDSQSEYADSFVTETPSPMPSRQPYATNTASASAPSDSEYSSRPRPPGACATQSWDATEPIDINQYLEMLVTNRAEQSLRAAREKEAAVKQRGELVKVQFFAWLVAKQKDISREKMAVLMKTLAIVDPMDCSSLQTAACFFSVKLSSIILHETCHEMSDYSETFTLCADYSTSAASL